MGWNGSENKGATSMPQRAVKKSPPSKGRGLVALVIIALGGALAIWFFGGQGKPATSGGEGTRRPTKIAEVKPQVVTNRTETAVAKPKKYSEMTTDEKLKYYKDKFGDNPPPGIAQVIYFLKNPPKKGVEPKSTFGYLRHSSERYLASVALAEPGTRFHVEPRMDPRFDRDFSLALEAPIEVYDDDSAAVAESKRAVEEMKREIAAMSAETGKKPSEIVYEHAMAMYELGQYQDKLRAQVNKIRDNPDFSDADYLDFVRAANQMLKEKGAGEMPLPNVSRRAFRLERLKRLEKKRQEKNNAAKN